MWILESYPNSQQWFKKVPNKIPRGLSWLKIKTFRKRDYSILFGQVFVVIILSYLFTNLGLIYKFGFDLL